MFEIWKQKLGNSGSSTEYLWWCYNTYCGGASPHLVLTEFATSSHMYICVCKVLCQSLLIQVVLNVDLPWKRFACS
jgi:hypothetical protein